MFLRDRGHVVVYTDGCCFNNGAYGARGGIGVWFGDHHQLNVSAPLEGRQTNNCAEIVAARVAIEAVADAGERKIQINTDSEFLVKAMTRWIHSWKRNGWRLEDGRAVRNMAEFMELDDATQMMDHVMWIHVPGHANVRGNVMADRLARQGASMCN